MAQFVFATAANARSWLDRILEIQKVADTTISEVEGVRGYMKLGDLQFLFNVGLTLPLNGTYLEIVSWAGLSAIAVANGLLANVNLKARIYCVDTWLGSIEHQGLTEIRNNALYHMFLENIRKTGMDGFITPIRATSLEAAATWEDASLDVIFIDGDHSFQPCFDDIVHWFPKLKPEGRMIGHDATPQGGVRKALATFKEKTGIDFVIDERNGTHYLWELVLNKESRKNSSRVFSSVAVGSHQKEPTVPADVVERIQQAHQRSTPGFAVNIGSGDGKSHNDPTYPLFQRGFSGIAVDASLPDAIFDTLPNPLVHKVQRQITPDNCVAVLHEHGCPADFDYLKIDIDGYDAVILQKLLNSGFRPNVITMEVNPEIPPPVKFSVLYHPKYKPTGKTGFYGCSFSYLLHVVKEYDYVPCLIDFATAFTHDVTLIKKEYLPLFSSSATISEHELFYSHPYRHSHFREIGIDSRNWRHRNDHAQLLGEIWLALIHANFSKHNHLEVPFALFL
ncbi:MAG: class I SAM-dependent methyltransferase [Desulfobacterota bacterium]|nr:class I SAM-dependent methyltransferase [Thermodesulfobacteriota bacterium]